jgi:hypothetical protein
MKLIGKVKTVTTAVATLIALGAGAAHAAPTDEEARGGSVVVTENAARNGTEYVAGGIWTYAVGNGSVVSVYDHSKVTHSASVKSSGKTTTSGKIAKGKVASASRPSAWTGNQAFWNIY